MYACEFGYVICMSVRICVYLAAMYLSSSILLHLLLHTNPLEQTIRSCCAKEKTIAVAPLTVSELSTWAHLPHNDTNTCQHTHTKHESFPVCSHSQSRSSISAYALYCCDSVCTVSINPSLFPKSLCFVPHMLPLPYCHPLPCVCLSITFLSCYSLQQLACVYSLTFGIYVPLIPLPIETRCFFPSNLVCASPSPPPPFPCPYYTPHHLVPPF